MSSKKLFESVYKTTQYQDYKDQREAFESVESVDNAEQLYTRKHTFEPQVDFSKPENFSKYGSAYYYYKGALDRIINFYPYDGSKAEQNKFYNELQSVEKYILNEKYPKSTGYGILCSDGWGSRTGGLSDGFGTPSTQEHITFKGGPNTGSAGSSLVSQGPDPESSFRNYGNIYDEDIYETAGLPSDYGKGTRLSNLRSNFDDGVTVEFWLKTGSLDAGATTQKQVILDLWNNQTPAAANNDYGRITILLDSTIDRPLRFRVESGSMSKTGSLGTTALRTNQTFGDWNHYAVTFYNTGSSFAAKLHVNGEFNHITSSALTMSEINSKGMMGRIGALLTATSGSTGAAGAGKLSGSIDEFRFWKAARNSKQIYENWFCQIGGGTNTDINNTELGVYFKFNEGITTSASVDSIVLDYGGRVSNAVWTGYGTNSRNTGSAMVSASAAPSEEADPIMRSNHPSYTGLRTALLETGSYYDSTNNSAFISYAPSWIIEQHEELGNENLKIISHIVGTHLDKIRLMAQAIPTFRYVNHTSASATPLPFANHLPQSLGLHVPDIFNDATIRELLSNRNSKEFLQGDLKKTKDLIYQNLYNNITTIYKSKGTEKSFRNVLRSFNIDDDLLRFKVYSNNQVYEISDNLRQIVKENKSVNFNNASHKEAVVYQRKDSTNPDSRGFISGSYNKTPTFENYYGFTAEADVIFPKFFKVKDTVGRSFLTSSLFGVVTVSTASTSHLDGTNTSFALQAGMPADHANFQVSAVRDEENSKNIRFRLESKNHPVPLPVLTSSLFYNAYDNQRWNISVRLKPKNYPYSGFVSGSVPSTTRGFTYDVIFRGIATNLGVISDSFEISSSVSYETGSAMATSPKRLYVGAYKDNLTGSVITKTDVTVSDVKYWTKFISNAALNQHLFDTENSGISGSQLNVSALDPNSRQLDITNRKTLALEWNFDSVISSSVGGTFTTIDFSSGSNVERTNYGWHGKIAGFQHSGYGQDFIASSKKVVKIDRLNSFKFIDPEENVSSNMIQILSDDDTLFDRYETIPNYLFTVEKSMYQSISEEMLIFLAGVIDFNNIIGEPVNRYRGRYKNLEKLRNSFFKRVTETKDVEKFVAYYKWFDEAISTIFEQLVPASMDMVPDITNTIESHVLERNKYETKFPTLEFKATDPAAVLHGFTSFAYPSTEGSTTMAASPRPTNKHLKYWKDRAERDASEITSGDATVDAQRDIIKRVVSSNPTLTSSNPVLVTRAGTAYNTDEYRRRTFAKNYDLKISDPNSSTIKGGVNFPANKNIGYTLTSLHPDGPIKTEGGVLVPENILLSLASDFVKIPYSLDNPEVPSAKVKRNVDVLTGRDNVEGDRNYSRVKSSMAFPFNIISSSVVSGYQSELSSAFGHPTRQGLNIEITNLHNDVYGDDMEKPMQGPFAEHNVGGLQYRHVAINKNATDNMNTRPEGWKILLGACNPIYSGAIGMVGPDYPHVTNYDPVKPYPNTSAKKAVFYRDHVAKRPVNIRNIKAVGPTVLGNFKENYEVIHTFGATSTPRQFVETQPTLPSGAFQNTATASTSIRTFLDTKPDRDHHGSPVGGSREHFAFVQDYSVSYLTGTVNKSVIKTRFAAPGGIEVSTPGYTDFRADEFSVYNSIPFRNLNVMKHHQPPSQSNPAGASVIVETRGIRPSDIHGYDFGLRPHLARHTARFGRDSLWVSGTTSTFQSSDPRSGAPGAHYDQLPGFHKIHRNNIKTFKPVYGTLATIKSQLINDKFVQWPSRTKGNGNIALIADSTKRAERVFDAVYADSNNKQVSFTWQAWIRNVTEGTAANLMSLGRGARDDVTSPKGLHVLTRDSGGKIQYTLYTRNDAGTDQGTIQWQTPSILTGSDFVHLVLTFTGSHGELENSPPGGVKRQVGIYLNGVRYIAENTNPTSTPRPYFQSSSVSISNFRGFGRTLPDPVTFFGSPTSNTNQEWCGDVDHMAMWSTALTDAQVTEIYNSGIPCNLTSSGTAASASLLSWWRMGEATSDGTDISGSSATMTLIDGTNRMTDVLNGANLLLTAQSGQNVLINTASTNARGDGLGGCIVYNYDYDAVIGYNSTVNNDNFFVSHQIPRSTKQYAWITSSLVSDNGWPGFVPKDGKISSSAGRINAYSFISASEIGSAVDGVTRFERFANTAQFLPQSVILNTNVVEPVSGASNTLGYPVSIPLSDTTETNRQYVNTDYIDTVSLDADAFAFNSVLFKRGGQYGFPMWKQMRHANHPILRKERETNKLSLINDTDENTTQYPMPPVSNRNRPVEVAYYVTGADGVVTAEVALTSHQRDYFNSPALNNKLFSTITTPLTSFESVVYAIAGSENLQMDYVMYTENVFPSIPNQFASHSSGRVNYSNGFWTSNRAERNALGAVEDRVYSPASTPAPYPGSFTRLNSFGVYASSSAWGLDAPEDLRVRPGPNLMFYEGNTIRDVWSLWRQSGSAGELQNTYMSYLTGTYIDPRPLKLGAPGGDFPSASMSERLRSFAPGALYAHKHMLSSPLSVASPYGIHIPKARRIRVTNNVGGVGSGLDQGIKVGTTPFDPDNRIPVFAGEALWEAGANAGIASTNADGVTTFVSKPSKPAYDSYDKFNDQMRLKTRGFSIVPEFRISEHVEDYIESGKFFPTGKYDTFSIPGTTDSSSNENFYQDFSNSEFMEQFREVQEFTGLGAREIKLVCTASIKFKPYNGFYPSERSLQLVQKFKDSFLTNISTKINSQVSGAAAAREGTIDPTQRLFAGEEILSGAAGALRPLCEALFAPGILYNSIKSGIAVDYPIMSDRVKTVAGGWSWYETATYGAGANKGVTGSSDYIISIRDQAVASVDIAGYYDGTGSFFDARIPFEAMINPQIIDGTTFVDINPHPSAALDVEGGFMAAAGPNRFIMPTTSSVFTTIKGARNKAYTLMASNFFGGVADFFLKDSQFTTLEGDTLPNDMKFNEGDVYMARVKMRRSVTGSRSYMYESSSFVASGDIGNKSNERKSAYAPGGGRALVPDLRQVITGLVPANEAMNYAGGNTFFELPQDPVNAPGFAETFTMYSRPSAFGPALAGTLEFGQGVAAQTAGEFKTPYSASYITSGAYQIMDSRTGFNWAYTPPYYNGEAWVDLVFRPSASVSYDLEKIFAETKTVHWRVDPGPKVISYYAKDGSATKTLEINSQRVSSTNPMIGLRQVGYKNGPSYTSLIHDPHSVSANFGVPIAPYGGSVVNDVAMQITSSVDLFGIESVPKQVVDPLSGMTVASETETVGKKWIIRTKFETPMLNFNDKFGLNPVTASSGNKTITKIDSAELFYGAETAPNGMWHQFGTIPQKNTEGVFLEIDDISENWLRHHYLVRNSGSVYNDNTADTLATLSVPGRVKSYKQLCGFGTDNDSKRIGELKDSLTVKEAIVAVPYLSNVMDPPNGTLPTSTAGKFLFQLPLAQVEASLDDLMNTPVGASLGIAGQSIRNQISLMQEYVLPPQFDFISNRSIQPIVMYIFEFEHTFDKDDLSYMWQNIMPRNYNKFDIKASSVSHTLAYNELFDAQDLLDSPNLRWQVFKVKQRVQSDYYDKKARDVATLPAAAKGSGYSIASALDDYAKFNWPYDYFSIVESIKLDAKVKYSNEPVEVIEPSSEPVATAADTMTDSGTLESAEVTEAAVTTTTTTGGSMSTRTREFSTPLAGVSYRSYSGGYL